ncbi:MAG: zinc-binding dehydrogenase [Anaerolineae bacterium]|nr:zinc-binding dehydrogenase [Anaerolineae bacterium]
MNYKSIVATKTGGPEVLQIVEKELREPGAGEARIKVLAASVCRPDITARRGEALYSGTPLGQKTPFVPGYSVIGTVDAIGARVSDVTVGDRVGVLAVAGGYAEYLYWRGDRLIPVPATLDPAQAVPLILNYIVAYQTLHRSARIQAGETVLIIGASGGIGTALLQLGQLAGLKMYGVASKSKHHILTGYGATPIDYRTQDFVEVIRQAEPDGLDVVLDGMMRLDYIRGSLSLLRHGGRLVSFGEPAGLAALWRILMTFVAVNVLPNGKSFKLYGTSSYFLGNKQPYLEDWATLFRLLEEGKIKPVIEAKFPLLEAAQANALLESGTVTGNVVLLAPEFFRAIGGEYVT